MTLFLDFETRSPVDIRKGGSYRYAMDPDTRVLMLAYAFDDGPVTLWTGEGLPAAVQDHAGPVVAHNAQFERLIFQHVLKAPIALERWVCTAAMARAVNLPASLDMCARVVLAGRKSPDGKALIRRFSTPRPDGGFNTPASAPEEWRAMQDYCRQDVELERDIWRKLPAWGGITARDYIVNERINDRGFGLDVPLARAASRMEGVVHGELRQEIDRLTCGAVVTPRGPTAAKWVYARLADGLKSIMTPEGKVSMARGVRADLLAADLPEEVRAVVQVCDDAAHGAVAKFRRAVQRHVGGRLYGSYILDGGSTTGRYAAVGVQPQNLPRDKPDDVEQTRDDILAGRGGLAEMKTMLRSMLIPAPGRTFVCADLSQIEGRVLPWLSDSEGGRAKLSIFADPSRDVYCETAADILGRPVTKADGDLRQNYGKIPELALGFGGSVGAILRTAKAYGADIGEEQAEYIVRSWRVSNRWAVRFWAQLRDASEAAFRQPGEMFRAGRVAYRRIPGSDTLQCALPDGESLLNYHVVRREDGSLTGMHTRSRPKKGVEEWPRVKLWHGILAENITQAVAARVQRRILAQLDARFAVVGHSHDEVIVEVPTEGVDAAQAEIEAVVVDRPSWAPGLPLAVESWNGQRYGK